VNVPTGQERLPALLSFLDGLCVFLMPARINSAKMPLPGATGVGGA